jgi:hypothetical protein
MDYSDIELRKRLNDLAREVYQLHDEMQVLSIALARVEKSQPKPMTAREAYDDALNAIAQIMSEPLTSVTMDKPFASSAIISDMVGEIKLRRDRNTGGR